MKKTHKILTLALILTLGVLVTSANLGFADKRVGAGVDNLQKAAEFQHAQFDGNTIANWLANDGLIVSHRKTGNSGLEWPKGSGKTIDYASGIWLAGKAPDGDIRTAWAEYASEFVPGPYGSDPDDPTNRIYIINSDGTGDWNNWPVAQGAPVNDDGTPKLIGDQTIFWVMNDGDEAQHANGNATKPMGVEVLCTVFGFNKSDPLGNVMFVQFEIINKGGLTMDSCYVAFFDDPDLGDASDDLVGCDTTLSLGYCYNGGPVDATYGTTPPAIGMDFFQGPEVPIGSGNYLPMTSFAYYWNGATAPNADPNNALETYNFMRGYLSDGTLNIDHEGNPTKFVFTGDPVAGTGYLDSSPADRRFLMCSGPFTLNPGDYQKVVSAKIIAPGTDAKSSITALKFFDSFAQTAFDNDFILPQPAAPVVNTSQEAGKIVLTWQDDNDLYKDIETYSFSGYDFEGYNIYQGESEAGPWTLIGTYDVINDFGIVFDNVFDAETGLVLQKPVANGTNSGLTRNFVIDSDKLTGYPLYNFKKYYFNVTSYALNAETSPKVAESGVKALTVVPHSAPLGIRTMADVGELIESEHVEGPGDGDAVALVLDSQALTGDTYAVSFREGDAGWVWDVTNKASGELVVDGWENQTGDENYPIVDGMKIYVTGPPPGVKDWDIPQGTRRFTWASADGLHFEGFNGAIGWAQPATLFGSGYNYPAGNLKKVVLVLAQVDENGNFDANDPNVSYGYRFLRGSTADPALPEFAPYIVNPGGGYMFQDFAKTVPLAAFDMEDPDNPRRLTVMYMENNQPFGLVDGKYFPGDYNLYNNTAGDGPREWLWISDEDYHETVKPEYQTDIISLELPIMYWLTFNRRGSVPFSPGGTGEDHFEILPNYINTENDIYEITPPAAMVGAAVAEAQLDNINIVPNPYWAWSPNETQPTTRIIRLTNMPEDGATVRIFTLAGELVRVIGDTEREAQGTLGTAYAEWDARNAADVPVASGVYLVHVEVDGVGEKVLKLAIVNRDERLIYY
jgi:hypothetical protein